MISHHYYKYFDITIESDFQIPELPQTCDKQSQIKIIYDFVPECLEAPDVVRPVFQTKNSLVLIKPPDGSRFLVDDGRVVAFVPEPTHKELMRQHLLSFALPVVLHQQKRHTLHGATVAHKDRCSLLLGASGSGKSTVSAGLWQQGLELLSDEIAMLDSKNGCLHVRTPYPRLQLWRNSLDSLQLSAHPKRQILLSEDKFDLILSDSTGTKMPGSSPESKRLSAIYLISDLRKAGDIQIKPFPKVRAIPNLIRHTYRKAFLRWTHRLPDLLTFFSGLVNRLEIYEVTFPHELSTLVEKSIPELADHIKRL